MTPEAAPVLQRCRRLTLLAGLLCAACAGTATSDFERSSTGAARPGPDGGGERAGPRYLANVDETNWPGPKIDLQLADTRVDPAVLLGPPGAEPLPELYVIAPPSIAYTSQPQPELYWLVTASVPYPVELRVDRPDRIAPAAISRLPPGTAAGLHCFAVGPAGGPLEQAVEHTWSVRILVDPEDPSNDPRAAAKLRYLPLPAGTRQALAAAAPDQRAGVLVADGFWYDGFALLMQEVAGTGDRGPAVYRKELLEDRAVGLERAALALADLPPAAGRASCP